MLFLSDAEVGAALRTGEHLKSGRDYDVVRFESNGASLVIKRARDPGLATGRLITEFERISLLVNISPVYRDAIVSPIGAGFYGQHFYYVLPFLEGVTLSSLLRSEPGINKAHAAVMDALDLAWRLQASIVDFPSNSRDFLSFIRQFIVGEHTAALPILPPDLVDRPVISVDGIQYQNLGNALNQLFELDSIRSLELIFTLETFRHWNLHGGNIIFDRNRNIHLIDPDTTIFLHDPLFEVARLFYTARHDMIEYQTFSIENASPSNFQISYMLNEKQRHNYTLLYDPYVPEQIDEVSILGATRSSVELRLSMSFLSCLVRGINANYEEGENDTPEARMTSNSIFLYLAATQFVNRLLGV